MGKKRPYMIKFTCQAIALVSGLLLSSCGDFTQLSFGAEPEADTNKSNITMSESAKRGQEIFESPTHGCANCHGLDGQLDTFKAINLTATKWTITSTGVSYPAVEYVELTMRPSNPSLCVGQCAEDVVAYMRYLAIENAHPDDDSEQSSEPPTPTSVLVPSRIEAEDYVRFYDTTGTVGLVDGDNIGDINIGYIDPGEWLEYDLYSETNATVNITLRVATRLDDKQVSIQLDGQDVDAVTAPNTGDWEVYSRVTIPNISMTANTNHELRIKFPDGRVNFNYFDVAKLVNLPEDQTKPLDVGETNTVLTPLARLTNTEFINSIRDVLKLANDSPNIEAARSKMAAESEVSGLTNDSATQNFSTSTIQGYLAVSSAAIDDLISGAEDIEDIRERIQCDALKIEFGRQANPNYSSVVCFRDFSRSLFTHIYGTPWKGDPGYFSDFIRDVETYVDYADLASETVEAMDVRLKAMAAYLFLTPEFLLFVENESEASNQRELSSVEIGKRLAYFLTATLPDEELAAAANSGSLVDPAVRLAHTNRLLESDLVSNQFASFFVGWLGVSTSVDQVEQSDVDSLTDWLSKWFEDSQPFENLYTGLYGVQTTNGSEIAMNMGVLGSKAFVASHTNNPVPAFINRGEFIASELLCADLPDDLPSSAFDEASTVSETPSELYHELKTKDCATCHHVADNFGAMFQQFDQETSLFNFNSSPYGEQFDLFELGDISGQFNDIEDFALTMGESNTAALCTSKLLYRHALRRGIDGSGADDTELDKMFNAWINSGDTSIKSLLRTIVASDHFATFYE
jgi:hypothetical protein